MWRGGESIPNVRPLATSGGERVARREMHRRSNEFLKKSKQNKRKQKTNGLLFLLGAEGK